MEEKARESARGVLPASATQEYRTSKGIKKIGLGQRKGEREGGIEAGRDRRGGGKVGRERERRVVSSGVIWWPLDLGIFAVVLLVSTFWREA